MHDDAIRDDIARLEQRIETLNRELERCRKISLAAKVAITAGAVWMIMVLATIASFVPGPFFGATAAVLGGIVLLGSNTTTWTQTEAALLAAEASRAQLIGRIELRLVGEPAGTLY